MLLAQYSRTSTSSYSSGPSSDEIMTIVVIYGVVFAVALLIKVMFLLSLSKALSLCKPRNRTMEPGLVWLNLIPIFELVWGFVTIVRVGDSLRNEFDDRRLRDDGDYGKQLGIIAMVLLIFCGIIGVICGIIYWVKIAGYNSTLSSSRRGRGDDDDDRPRRRRDVDDDYNERFRDRDRKKRDEGDPDRGDDDKDRYRDR
jgi:hypothetical protein